MFRPLITGIVLASISISFVSAEIHELSPRQVQVTQKAELIVVVKGIRNATGRIIIQLWNSPSGFPEHSEQRFKEATKDASSAADGVVKTSFEDLALGTYAVSVLHDEDNNGRMDKNAFGVPREGIAVSNHLVKVMRAPTFGEASFAISAPQKKIFLELRY